MFSPTLMESTQFSCMWWGGEIIAKCPRIIMKVFASIVFLIGLNFYSISRMTSPKRKAADTLTKF